MGTLLLYVIQHFVTSRANMTYYELKCAIIGLIMGLCVIIS